MKVSILLNILRQFSKKIAQVQTFLILTIVYFIVLPLFSLLLKIIKEKAQKKSTWGVWKLRANTIHDLRRQL